MEWLQFISSIIGSLAWPVAVVIFLFLTRKRLGDLLERLIELHLPGGAKAIFKEALAEGRVIIERSAQAIATTSEHDQRNNKVWTPPADYREIILDNFLDVNEQIILLARERGFEERKGTIHDMVEKFLRSDQIDPTLADLYERLRKARNASLHVGTRELSDQEVDEFVKQANVLLKKVKELRKRA